MNLRLQIENVSTLPDGGPLGMTVTGKRGIDIGRDQHLDWTLPDPSRFVSGKHCEIRYHDEAYWLHDRSTNGTFVNNAEEPIRGPHRLRTGDKIEIGPYVIAVEVLGDAAPAAAGPARRPAAAEDLWTIDADGIAPPVEPERRRRVASVPTGGDFLEQRFEGLGPADESFWAHRDARPDRGAQERAQPKPEPRPRSIWDDEADEALPEPEDLAPAPPPAPRPSPEPERSVAPSPSGDAILRAFAKGLGVPDSVLAGFTPEALAQLAGTLVRISADNLSQLLLARSELKDIVRTPRTVVMAADNNPLKLAPTIEDALALMFAPASASYLDAAAAFKQSFHDLKHHQLQTIAAMQIAVTELSKDFEPRRIEAQLEPDRGIGAMVGSRKARLWDTYVARWRAQVERREDGLLGVFLDHFSEHYGRRADRRPP